MSKKKSQSEKLIAKKFKSPRVSLVESKSRHGMCYGYCVHDGAPVMLSDDKSVALDFLYSLTRGEVQPHGKLIDAGSAADTVDADLEPDDAEVITVPDAIAEGESLSASEEEDETDV